MSSVFERLNLRFAFMSIRRFEMNSVIAFGIERRIEKNQVNAGIGKLFAVAQQIQIVAEKQSR